MVGELQLFLREFRRSFHTTGAIAPSGKRLAAALARWVEPDSAPEAVRAGAGRAGAAARRILEVGPGTGAVTRAIVRRMGPRDRLDLVELNETFVDHLRRAFGTEAALAAVAERTRILHRPVQEIIDQGPYDLIISGLPLNNFSVANVEEILEALGRLAAPGAVLSFFQYVAIRRARALVSSGRERARLRGIGRALASALEGREIRRECVLMNVPPAWVHHLRMPGLEAPGAKVGECQRAGKPA